MGRQPHETIHQWFQCLDVGLIPYTDTQFNRFCSPMRLFDHLASGAPVVATDACDQAKAFANRVSVCSSPEAFAAAVQARMGEPREAVEGILWSDRATGILNVLERLNHA
jgi:teichuronic acid biosynthesis glycosyltransferase TuaH